MVSKKQTNKMVKWFITFLLWTLAAPSNYFMPKIFPNGPKLMEVGG